MAVKIVPVAKRHLPDLRKRVLEFFSEKIPNPEKDVFVQDLLHDAEEAAAGKHARVVVIAVDEKGGIAGVSNAVHLDGGLARDRWTYSFKKPAAEGKGTGVGGLLFRKKIELLRNQGARIIGGTATNDAARKMVENTARNLGMTLEWKLKGKTHDFVLKG